MRIPIRTLNQRQFDLKVKQPGINHPIEDYSHNLNAKLREALKSTEKNGKELLTTSNR